MSLRSVAADVVNGWRWGAAAAAIAAILIAMVLWLSRQRVPAYPVGPDVVKPPWSTSLSGQPNGGQIVWTLNMTNQESRPLTVQPWTHPFRLIVTPMATHGKPASWAGPFPNMLKIPVRRSHRLMVITPAPSPGWYYVTTSTVGVTTSSGSWDRTNVAASFFEPSPPGTIRTGTLTLHQSQTRGGYTMTARRLAMTSQKTAFTFAIDRVSIFPTNVSVRIDAGGRQIGGWRLTQRSSSGQAVARSVGVVATVLANPVPKSARTLTVTVFNLGARPSGKPRASGPWVFHIRLPAPS